MSNKTSGIYRGLFISLVIAVTVLSGIGEGGANDFFKKEKATVKESHEKAKQGLKDERAGDAAKKTREHPVVSPVSSTQGETAALGPEEGLKRLAEGNKRSVAGKMVHKGQNAVRRAETAEAQHPFAVILSCSDSRVPPEIIFDQGLGDLFVIRTAGHVADDVAIGSIEYAVEHLGVRLVMVLGHKRCGAVEATVKGGEAPGQIGKIVEAIKPAVEKARAKHGDLLDESVKANVKIVAQKLKAAPPVLAETAEDGVLKIIGGYYDLDTGAVSVTYKPCM